AGSLRAQIADWTRQRGKSPRLYPGALVWCLKKPGRDLREKIEVSLAWKRVAREVADGTLGGEFDKSDRAELQSKVKDSEEAAKDEVWGDYRFAVVADGQEADGLKVIDLGAGHSSSGETLCGRVIAALKPEALLNESVGAGYIERNWPPALKDSGAWPLASLRQSFLNGSLTRLVDPDAILKNKIVEFVGRGDFGLASGLKTDRTYERLWFQELVAPDEVAFESGVFLLRKVAVEALKRGGPAPPTPTKPPEVGSTTPTTPVPESEPHPEPTPDAPTRTLRLVGTVPPELWNRLGTKILPKLRTGSELKAGLDFSVKVKVESAGALESELRQILQELGLTDSVRLE
ncbi:MAG: AAA family ATPase, partial [Candidatus Rokubacteria bacterium]|nr:AAA family ATPase [Candidatus Rokubacteria bacterium]